MSERSMKWDSTATVGLVTLLAVSLLIVALIIGLSRPPKKEPIPDSVPENAVPVELPEEQLLEMENRLTPLLLGQVEAFTGPEDIKVDQVMQALLFHGVWEATAFEETEDGAAKVPFVWAEERFEALFGQKLPYKEVNAEGLRYEPETDEYVVYAHTTTNAHWYSGENHWVNIVSTQTLDDTVFVHAEVIGETLVTPTPEVTPTPSETPLPEATEEGEETAAPQETEETEETAQLTATPEPTPTPTPVLEEHTDRKVVCTLLYENGRYTLMAMRDVE